MVVYGFGKMLYDPAMQSYLGEKIPYTRRAQAIGITELSWAGSLMVAAPVAGVLLDISSIQSIFVLLTGRMLCALVVIRVYFPPDEPHKITTSRFINPLIAWRILRRSPAG